MNFITIQLGLMPSMMDDREVANGSPVSVVSSKIQEPPKKRLAPTVVMSDDGAEVTLHMDLSEPTVSTPKKARGKNSLFETVALTPNAAMERRFIINSLPTHSLMDNEATPSPMSPPRKGSTNLWCSSQNIGCYKCEDQEDLTVTNKSMENTISNFLGSPIGMDEWCTSWQAWTYYEMDGNMETERGGLKANIKCVLRNRAGNMGSRSSRISTLKQNLHPFDTTPKRKSTPLARATSFGVDHRRSKHFKSLSSIPSVMDWSEPVHENSDFVIRSRGLEDELFYDSDPEECTKRRSPTKSSHRSRMSTFWSKPIPKQWTFDSAGSSDKDVDRSVESININDSQVGEHVQEFLNQRFTLVWHPSVKKNSKPVAIVAWIERGQHLPYTLIQPRLVWKRLHDGKTLSDRHSVDLLDISRVIEAGRVNRNRYPLAQRKKCLLIQCLDENMLFEASNEKERDRLCRDLKLVVARLGSKIIMEDSQLFEEFFVMDPQVPGEAPRWAQSEQQYT
jgi:hypothetical protein